MKNQRTKKAKRSILLSAVAILSSFIIAMILIAMIGKSPYLAFSSLFKGAFGSKIAVANTLSKTIPLVLAGLSAAVAFRGGMLNIGIEGQLHMGAIFAFLACVLLPNNTPHIIALFACVVAAALGGMLWGAVIGVLKVKLRVHEVIIAILLNYIAIGITSYLINFPFKGQAGLPETDFIEKAFRFRSLVDGSQFTGAIFLMALTLIIVYIIIYRTAFGYKIRAVGNNMTAAEAGGMSIDRTIVSTMSLSGAIAGLIGATFLLGTYGKLFDGFSGGVGFTGLAVAFLANSHPVFIFLSGLLFGALDNGMRLMSLRAGLSSNLVVIIQSLVIFFIATPHLFNRLLRERR